MKRLVLGLLLAGFALTARAQTPDTEFLEIYTLIQEGETLETDGQFGPALDRFQQAQRSLQAFAKAHPSWNDRIVKFRLGYLEEKLGKVSAKTPVPTAPAASPTPVPALVEAGKTNGGTVEVAALKSRLEDAEGRVTAAEARREAALRSADLATARANEATDRASRLALELRDARDRVEVLESAHGNLEKTRDRLEMERSTLESRLKEALSPKAAAIDPAELAKAEERILMLVKENEVLKAGLDRQLADNRAILAKAKNAIELERQLESARADLASQRRQIDDLRGERQKLQARLETFSKKGDDRDAGLRTEVETLRRELAAARSEAAARTNSVDADKELSALREQLAGQKKSTDDLRRENDQLAREIEKLTAIGVTPASLKVAEIPGGEPPIDPARVRKLERERDDLRKELDDARAELQRRDPAMAESRTRQLAREVDRLQSRVAALEAKPDPYTPEELALFQGPRQVALADGAAAPSTPISRAAGPSVTEAEKPAHALAQAGTPAAAPAATPAPDSTPAPTASPAKSPGTNAPATPPAAGPGSGATKGTNAVPASATARRRTTKDLPPGAGVIAAQAQRAFAQRRYGEAEAAYREILKMDENNVFTVGNLAAILVEQGRIDDGEVMAKRALAIDPQDPFSLSLLGIIRFRQQRYDEAFDALSQSAQLDPENSETQNYLGITLSQRGQRPAAEAALRKAIKLNPGSPTAHYNLAVVYATQKPPFFELARFHYEKSRRGGQPANPQFEELLRGGGSTPAPAASPAPAATPDAKKP